MDKLIEIGRRLLESEPAVVIGLVAAALGLAASFGITIQDAQAEAIKDFVAQALIFVAMLAGIRRSVFSPATHEAEVAAAYDSGLSTGQRLGAPTAEDYAESEPA